MPRKFLNGLAPSPALPISGGGTGATTAAGSRAALGLNSAAVESFRNRLINGAFAIMQRGVASASTSYAAGTYLFDGWKAGTGGVTLSYGTAGSGDNVLTITAGTLVQVIEGALYLPEGGAYGLSWGGTATARIYQGSASGSYGASPVLASGLTAGSNTTVEFGTGTLAQVQFEPGTATTPFERRDDEVRRCQRYCIKSYALTTPPKTNTTAGQIGHLCEGSASNPSQYVHLPVEMAGTPTVTTYTQAGTAGSMNINATEVTATVAFTGPRGFLAYTNTAATAGQTISLHYLAEFKL